MNKYGKKESIAFLLICSMIFTIMITSFGSANSDKNYDLSKVNIFHLKLKYNDKVAPDTQLSTNQIERKFKKNKEDIKSNRSRIDIAIRNLEEIKIGNDISFDAEGTITIADEKYSIFLKGSLEALKNANGKIVLLGALRGYLNGIESDENSIILSVHYVPDDDTCLISATFGVANDKGDTSNIAFLEFGEYSDEIKEAAINHFQKIKEDKEKKPNDSENSMDSSLQDYGAVPPWQNDVKVQKLRGKTSGIFGLLAFPDKAHDHEDFFVGAKMNVNYQIMSKFIHDNIDSGIVYAGTTSVTTARIRVYTTDANTILKTFSPIDSQNTVNLTLPIWYGNTFGWQFTNFSYTLSSTMVQTKKNGSVPYGAYNDIEWEFYHSMGLAGKKVFNTGILDTGYDNSKEAGRSDNGLVANATFSYGIYGVSKPEKKIIKADFSADCNYDKKYLIFYYGSTVPIKITTKDDYITIVKHGINLNKA